MISVHTTALVDTTVFCNVIRVPGRDQNVREVQRLHEERLRAGWSLLLPIAVMVETGNHIAHAADGRLRRASADRFAKAVRGAIDGSAPWTPASAWGLDEVRAWLQEFPDSAMRGVSFADMTIVKEYERLRVAAPRHRIWSLDRHLQGYDTGER